MIWLTRLTRWALRTAAQRWPADLREDLHAEWQAELAYLETRPGTGAQRLRFALSLLTSPPARDAAGVPRGWAEARSGVSPAAALMLAAVLALGAAGLTSDLASGLLDNLGDDYGLSLFGWPGVLTDAAMLALWCVPAAWVLGRRLPMARDGRLGPSGPAVLAPLAVLPVLFLPDADDGAGLPSATLLGAVVWTVSIMVIARAVARAGTPVTAALTALAGVPLAALLATAGAAVPQLVKYGWAAAVESVLMTDSGALPFDESGVAVFVGGMAGTYLAFGALVVAYGRRAAGAPDRPVRLAAALTEPAATARPALHRAVPVAGAVAVVGGVVAWACTVTYLTPAMPLMSEAAPMPGGDGEIYMWVGELRWAGILLAALGVTVATAHRRFPGRAAAVFAVALLVTESVLLNNGVERAAGLRIALVAAAVAIAATWSVAGPALGLVAARVARGRTVAAAITATALGPLLYAQGTPPENHPFMPLGLPVTTVGVSTGLVLLGTVTAVLAGVHRPHPAVAAAIVGLPAALLLYLGTDLGNGATDPVAEWAMLLGLPLAVAVTAVLSRHRPRRPGRTAAIWTLLAVAAVPASVVLYAAAMMPLSFVAGLLFQIDGTSYPFDGVSVLPGAALLVLPAAAWLGRRADGTARSATRPGPAPQPVTGTSG